MTDHKPIGSHVFVLALTLALVAYTVASYPPELVGLVAGCTGLLVVVLTAGQRLLPHRRRRTEWSLRPLALFLLVFSTVSTIQVLVAHQVYGPRFSVDSTPGYRILVLLVHGIAIAGIICTAKEKLPTTGLCLAAVYSSILYIPSFAVPEAVPPFVSLAALSLVLLITLPRGQRKWPFSKRLLYPALLLVVLSVIAALSSDAPHESWVWVRKLLVLLLLGALIPLIVDTTDRWNVLAQIVVLSSVGIPVLLSITKLLDLWVQLGLRPALSYKLMLNELGRANLIARTLVTGGALLVAQVLASSQRVLRILMWILAGLALGVLAACRSWGAWIAVALSGGFLVVLLHGHCCRTWWQEHLSPIVRVLLATTVLAGLGLSLSLALWWAPRANIESFNGRLVHARIALSELADHLWLGVGPGHHYSQARYAGDVDWLLDTQSTLDHPGRTIELIRLYATMHTHNLFTEIGVGTGLLGLGAFVWLLIELLRSGLKNRAGLYGTARTLATGCLVGIVASIGWGMLDVMEISPPLFSFPSWALIGLLLAARRALGVKRQQTSVQAHTLDTLVGRLIHAPKLKATQLFRQVPIWLAAIVVVFLPLLGNLHYRAAYLAYQERRGEAAAEELIRTERWQPFDAQTQQLRALSLINLGHYDQAIAAYKSALDKRTDFGPYHAQLGWLYWLDGDLQQAQSHLELAVRMDPREAWRKGVHAELALIYVAQGHVESALPLLQQTIQLDSQTSQAPYWIRRLESDGAYDVVLDPAYLRLGSAEQGDKAQDALQRRILAHLGKPDYTRRLFNNDLDAPSPLSLNQVLDAIETDYQAAHAAASPKAPRLLAAAAEAAQFAGLYARAERAYRVFQDVYPTSAYGFYGLGTLYHVQGRLADAQAMLQAAVNVSPRDARSWAALAEVSIKQSHWSQAVQALDTFHILEPLDVDVYRLRARLYRERDEPAKEATALRQALYIEESVSDRLALADLYQRLGQARLAAQQCDRASAALLRTFPRLWDSQLRQVGRCLARSTIPEPPRRGRYAQPAVRQVLQGHTYRAQGRPDWALDVYLRAVDSLEQAGQPDAGAAHYFVGEIELAQGNLERATTAYQQAAQHAPLESLPMLALGNLQWSQGQHQAAQQSFRSAVTATPGWETAHIALGNALLANHDPESAARHYRLAQIAAGDIDDRLVYDFVASLASASIQTLDPDFVRSSEFAIDGIRQPVIFAHPASRITYDLFLDQDTVLAFELAVDPSSWSEVGDGVTFTVTIELDAGSSGADETRDILLDTYIDPKQNQADRHWHPFAIDLAAYTGSKVTIAFETNAGPAGDQRYDWAGWGSLRLLGQAEATWTQPPG